jgi:autotransporter-associated beta strand protein
MKTILRRSQSDHLHIGVLAVCLLMLQLLSAHASTFSWSGGGSSGNWSDSGNWGFAGTPTNGDIVVFVTGQPRPNNTNNIPGLTLSEIRFVGAGGGYGIYGNGFTLTNGIQATNTVGANTINNSIVLATIDTPVNVISSLGLNGALSGSVGLTKTGVGTLTFAGNFANTYAGTTRVNAGVLQLNRNGFDDALVGPLIIGTGSGTAMVQLLQGLEIGNSVLVTVKTGGTFDLNNTSETIDSLDMAGGFVTSGTGTLFLNNGNTFTVSAQQTSAINGNLNIGNTTCIWTQAPLTFVSIAASVSGSANIIDNGPGEVFLAASNSFTGSITLNNGFIGIGNSWALGATNGGTTINETASLGIFGDAINVAGEPLVLKSFTGYLGNSGIYSYGIGGSNLWGGPITLGANATIGGLGGITLNILGGISGGGFGVTKTGGGTLFYSGTNSNTYTGTTAVNAGTLALRKAFLQTAIAGNVTVSGTLRLDSFDQITDTADVLVNNGGVFDFGNQSDTIDTLRGNGSVTFGVLGYLTVGANGGSSTFNGIMSGTGYPGGYTVQKIGGGTFTMNANNTYSNATQISGGKLIVNGSQPQSPITFAGVTPRTLGGSGFVGNIVAADGTIAPGTSPGILSCSNVLLTSSAVFAVELNGNSPGLGYDQLSIHGTNNLGGATLSVSAGGAFAPVEGSPLTIIDNDGSDLNVGTFNGLPEGSVIAVGALKLRLSYVGGTGNDVTLTLTNPPILGVAASLAAGNGNSDIDPGECNSLFLTITNTTAGPLTGVSATLATTTPGVVIPQFTVTYPDLAVNGKATNTLPFQITTQPWFVAGTNIQLMLSVTSSAGSFSTFFTVPSGGVGTPVRFDNFTPGSITDFATNSSSMFVSGITSAVAKVTVSMNITHTFDGDLDIYLVAPDGTTVELTTDNGGSGDNYGTGCPDGTRTAFDDSAATSILAGSAPYVGTFRSEEALSKFRGVNPNGFWTLQVADDASGDTGTLNCWSLFISPATSTNGGGVCDLCPNVTLASAIGISNPGQSDRLSRNGSPSSCAVPTGCPGNVFLDSPNYDTFTFRNGPSNACINVTLTSAAADVFSATYLGSYDPSDLCSNYLADSGNSTFDAGGSVSYSFSVSSNATFIVEVNSIFGSAGPYKISVTGGDCRPVLNIKPAGTNVVVNWTTAAAGYQLERTNSLPALTNWSAVPEIPGIVSGRYQVTNGVPGNTKQFYRLHKSLP